VLGFGVLGGDLRAFSERLGRELAEWPDVSSGAELFDMVGMDDCQSLQDTKHSSCQAETASANG